MNYDTKCASFDIQTFGSIIESSSAYKSIASAYDVSYPTCAAIPSSTSSFKVAIDEIFNVKSEINYLATAPPGIRFTYKTGGYSALYKKGKKAFSAMVAILAIALIILAIFLIIGCVR